MFSALKHLRFRSRHKRTFNFGSPLHQTLYSLVERCSTMKELKFLQAQIILRGLTREIQLLGKLISFCAVSDPGDLRYAQLMFDELLKPNRYMYNSLIRGYSKSDDPLKAITLFKLMVSSAISPNKFTFPFVLKVCASKSLYLEGELIHVQVIKLGFGLQICVQNSLISVYLSSGSIGNARKVFDEITERSLVSWNSIICGYSKLGCLEEVLVLFKEMRELKFEPDDFTFVSLLSICSQKCDVKLGRLLHQYIEISGVKTDVFVQNSLLDMYAKFGHLDMARAVFNRIINKNVVSWTSMVNAYAKQGFIELALETFNQIPIKNVVSWNSMISCFVQTGRFKESLDLFDKMRDSKITPDETTLVSVLSACSQLGDLSRGKNTHDYVQANIVKPSITLYNALIDMYAKCGLLDIAAEIFHNMSEKNTASFNVMIGAFALHGHGFKAINLFENMEIHGISPDEITFTGLLSACTHCGLLEIGRYYFDRMSDFYNISPQIEHFACLVDLLGRKGLLEEAIHLIQGMPMKPDVVVWGALLGACKKNRGGDINTAKQILKQVLELDLDGGGLFVLISNIYGEAQRWEDVKRLRKLMKVYSLKKGSGFSSVAIGG